MTENHKFLEEIEAQVAKRKGRAKRGIINKLELECDEEVRVSIRSTRCPSIELFTIRNLEPQNYHLLLIAVPREENHQ